MPNQLRCCDIILRPDLARVEYTTPVIDACTKKSIGRVLSRSHQLDQMIFLCRHSIMLRGSRFDVFESVYHSDHVSLNYR